MNRLVFCLAAAPLWASAFAGPITVTISFNGGQSRTWGDGGAGDDDPTGNSIFLDAATLRNFFPTLGPGSFISVSSNQGDDPTDAFVSQTIDLHVGAAGPSNQTFFVRTSQTGFGPPSGNLQVVTTETGGFTRDLGGMASSRGVADPNNAYNSFAGVSPGLHSDFATISGFQAFGYALGPATFNASNPYSITSGSVLTLNRGSSIEDTFVTEVTAAPTPEPASLIAMGLGVCALVRRRRSVATE